MLSAICLLLSLWMVGGKGKWCRCGLFVFPFAIIMLYIWLISHGHSVTKKKKKMVSIFFLAKKHNLSTEKENHFLVHPLSVFLSKMTKGGDGFFVAFSFPETWRDILGSSSSLPRPNVHHLQLRCGNIKTKSLSSWEQSNIGDDSSRHDAHYFLVVLYLY